MGPNITQSPTIMTIQIALLSYYKLQCLKDDIIEAKLGQQTLQATPSACLSPIPIIFRVGMSEL